MALGRVTVTEDTHPILPGACCEVLFMPGCKGVGWHQPADGWMPLEMSTCVKAQLCHPHFRRLMLLFPCCPLWDVLRGAEATSKGNSPVAIMLPCSSDVFRSATLLVTRLSWSLGVPGLSGITGLSAPPSLLSFGEMLFSNHQPCKHAWAVLK